ncbi:MAG TPA: zinc ribbon domain-containing protein [Coleofasciculaceae cyanobacterium]
MQNCPRCHQSISSQSVNCPHCGTAIKAFGHPGITLHRATGDTTLCESCTYHTDDTCTFPQRPDAKECTLYNDMNKPQLKTSQIYTPRRGVLRSLNLWYQQNPAAIGLLGLVLVSFLLALITLSQ